MSLTLFSPEGIFLFVNWTWAGSGFNRIRPKTRGGGGSASKLFSSASMWSDSGENYSDVQQLFWIYSYRNYPDCSTKWSESLAEGSGFPSKMIRNSQQNDPNPHLNHLDSIATISPLLNDSESASKKKLILPPWEFISCVYECLAFPNLVMKVYC